MIRATLAAIACGAWLAACASALGGAPSIDPSIQEIDDYFSAEAQASRFSGVVLVARGDRILLERGYGFADFENASEMRADSVLRIGSLTKPVTASAVLVTVRNGRMGLDDSICNSLSSCPDSWRAVRIRHLLTHTSGITDHFGDLEARPVEQTAEELRRVLSALSPAEALNSPPGEAYAYSNFNYVLLGVALERAYGAPWETVLRNTVLAPQGVSDVAYDDVWAITPQRARGYDRTDDAGLRNIEYDDHAAYAAGGLRATARGLFTWSRGVFSGRLFGEALTREALTPGQGNYGFGWQVRRFFGREMQNHSGGIDGFASHLAHYQDDDITIIVLSNVESEPAILRACDVAAVMFGVRRWTPDHSWNDLAPRDRCAVER